MVNKMADEASAILLLICSYEVRIKVTHNWSTALFLCLCLCRPSFHQLKLRHKRKHKAGQGERTCPFFLYECLCLCASKNQETVNLKVTTVMTNSASGLACENIRFSSFFVAEDVSLGRTSFLRAKRPQRRRARRNGCFRRLPSGQDGPQICPARKSCLYFGHIINPLLTKLVRSRWFGYWLVHLCVFIYIRNVDFVWTRFETVAYGRHSLRFLGPQ